MPLYLATHTVDAVTAKVPLSIIILLDHLKRKSLPADLKLRLVMPTAGTVHISLWDAPDAESLLGWLNEALNMDGVHEVSEVQEEFSWGMTFELARVRASEKVAAGGRTTLEKLTSTAKRGGDVLQQQLEALDQRTNILTATENAINRVRSAATTSGPSGSTGAAAYTPYDPSAPTPTPSTSSTVAASVTAGLTKAGSTLSWLSGKMKGALAPSVTATAGGATISTTAAPGWGTGGTDAGGSHSGGAGGDDLLGGGHYSEPPPPAYDSLLPVSTATTSSLPTSTPAASAPPIPVSTSAPAPAAAPPAPAPAAATGGLASPGTSTGAAAGAGASTGTHASTDKGAAPAAAVPATPEQPVVPVSFTPAVPTFTLDDDPDTPPAPAAAAGGGVSSS